MDKLRENQISEKMPEDIVKVMAEIKVAKMDLAQDFLRSAYKLESVKKRVADVYSRIEEKEKQVSQKIKYAFDKLKLKKKTEYSWRFDGKDTFIGTKVEKKEEKVNENS